MAMVEVQWNRLAEEMSNLLCLLEYPPYPCFMSMPTGEMVIRGCDLKELEQLTSDHVMRHFLGSNWPGAYWESRELHWRKLKHQTEIVAAFIPREPDIPDCKSWEHAKLDRLQKELQRLREYYCMDGEEPVYMRTDELRKSAKDLRLLAQWIFDRLG